MLRLTAEITGKTEGELELGLEEIQRLVSEGYWTTAGYPSLSFDIEGEEESEEESEGEE